MSISRVEILQGLVSAKEVLEHNIRIYKSLGQYHQRAYAEDLLDKVTEQIKEFSVDEGKGEIQGNT